MIWCKFPMKGSPGGPGGGRGVCLFVVMCLMKKIIVELEELEGKEEELTWLVELLQVFARYGKDVRKIVFLQTSSKIHAWKMEKNYSISHCHPKLRTNCFG